ncbi:ABC transporter ATP-binding protein [Macrococcus equipercicus]|nr:ABC transporter ATP-binding protein [Macrococcus equipercicus]
MSNEMNEVNATNDIKVKVENVTKVYEVNQNKKDKILSVLKFWQNNDSDNVYYALRNISFVVNAGDSIGLVGLNGAGKSTLSNLLGEVTVPTAGSIKINGRSSLIAISAGLNNELTGEENIRMKCLMHGMSEALINERYQDIIQFSELGEFIKQPIKTYSSGMKSRLGFAIAVHTDPDVLIVDEALSVGDDTFSNKCIERMKQFQAEGKTIFFVSHSAEQIRKMCNKAIWLHYGEVKAAGECQSIVKDYTDFVKDYNQKTKPEQLEYKEKMSQAQYAPYQAEKEKSSTSISSLFYLVLLVMFFVGSLLSQLHIINFLN